MTQGRDDDDPERRSSTGGSAGGSSETELGQGMDPELARLSSVDLNLLVPLLAVLEERSVTRAAARVGLSQPAMSHALRRLRRLIDDELVVRRGSGMMLTPRAQELIAPLRRTLRHTARLLRPADFDPAIDARVVTLAMTTSTAYVIGHIVARRVAQEAPNVVLRLHTTTEASDSVFTSDGADLLLLSEGIGTPLERERLYDDRWVVITNSDAPAGATALELLEALPHVMFDSGRRRTRPYQILGERGVHYTVRARMSDNLLIPHLIAEAGGVALHRYRVAVALARHFDLRVEEFPFPILGLGIDMVWNPWLPDDGLKPWLESLLRDVAGQL